MVATTIAVNEYLTTQEAARRIGVSASRIRQLIIAGKLPAIKLGRDHFIKTSDVTDYRSKPEVAP